MAGEKLARCQRAAARRFAAGGVRRDVSCTARDGAEATLIGIEFTTFSLIGRCERTGMLGIAIATSEMAVGSRCIHVAPGVGAVVTQTSTNPRLGHLGLNLLRVGYSAPHVLHELAPNKHIVLRQQLGLLDVSRLDAA